MKVSVRRIDKELPLPKYHTDGAVGIDCIVRTDTSIPAGACGLAPLNISIKLPLRHFAMLSARSSLHKRGVMLANGIGIFDEDFSGDEDEYKAILYNFTDNPVEIKRGERIAQILVLPFERVEWNEVDTLNSPMRGGLGTTGL